MLLIAGACIAGPPRPASGETIGAFSFERIVEGNTPRPDGQGFWDAISASTDGTSVVFQSAYSLWSANIKTRHLTKLADGATPAPGGTGNFTNFGIGDGIYAGYAVIVRNGTAVFVANDTVGVGIWSEPATGGAIRLVANYKTASSPDCTAGCISSFGMSDTGAVVFAAFNNGTAADGFALGDSVYTVRPDGSHLAAIADDDHRFEAPGSNRNPAVQCVGDFGNVAAGGDTVVFSGSVIEQVPVATSIYAQPVGSQPLGTSPVNQACELKGSVGPGVWNWLKPLPGNPFPNPEPLSEFTQADGTKAYFQACDQTQNGCGSTVTDSSWGGIFSVPLPRGAVTPIIETGKRLPRIRGGDRSCRAVFGR